MAPKREQIRDLKASLDKRFKIKYLGNVVYYLRMQIIRNRKKRIIYVYQANYIK